MAAALNRAGPDPTIPKVVPPLLAKLWRQAGFQPNEAQQQAILTVDGPLYLPAGPGSGKTRVLLWRTVNLIVCQRVDPNRIFLGTFTEKGAHQLREGLRGLLAMATNETREPYDISNMAVGTIHSICGRLLERRELTKDGRRPRPPALLDEFAQYQFVDRRWSDLVAAAGMDKDTANHDVISFLDPRHKSSKARHYAVVAALGFFNRCSEESVDPARHRAKSIVGSLLKMYAAYREILTENPDRQLTDLSLLQEHAYRAITDSEAGTKLFDHVIVDEYQDTNPIQEKIYFRLASGSGNLCVVGDDDQSLYRFRGATTDNFVEFKARCRSHLGRTPRTIKLVKNYRSRPAIVRYYNRFIKAFSWTIRGEAFRVDKEIVATRDDDLPAVFSPSPAKPVAVAEEVADVVAKMLKEGRVADPNEIAFLFPSLQSKSVERLQEALEAKDLKVYAPRAHTFLETPEAKLVLGTYLAIFGRPHHVYSEFHGWMEAAEAEATDAIQADRALAAFVRDRQAEIAGVLDTGRRLVAAAAEAGFGLDDVFDDGVRDALKVAPGLASRTRSFLGSRSLDAYVRHQRERRPDRPITVGYVVNRAATLRWGVLDLFYQLTAFQTFRDLFDLAESGEDEGPVCNLSLVSDYLARFQEQTSPVITAGFLEDRNFMHRFFNRYIYSIFRLGQSEYEDKQDPFPKGRIPFLTIHQAKGLEFPVVVLGNLRRDNRGPRPLDKLMAKLGEKRREPLDAGVEYDIARMFYVALSRAKQVLILCPYKGAGQHYLDAFKGEVAELATPLSDLDVRTIEPHEAEEAPVPRPYSFTGDYIGYQTCPRRYMIYRRYNFVPSRSQTQVFGTLVHRTIEDLHQFLMQRRDDMKEASR